jgi:hypothetical protein
MVALKVTPTNLIDPIRCPHCKEMAYVIRRSPEGFKRDGAEVWTFACPNGHYTSISDQQ